MSATGEAPDNIHLVDGPEQVDNVRFRDPSRVACLADDAVGRQRSRRSRRCGRSFRCCRTAVDDVYATQNRQVAVKEIAPQSDLVIVVGSPNSSNSVRLVEVALDSGAPAAYLVDSAEALDESVARGAVPLSASMSGTCAPEELVQGVLGLALRAPFGQRRRRVGSCRQESLLFALPPELRRDMRAASAAG